jgi:hypothetical protein
MFIGNIMQHAQNVFLQNAVRHLDKKYIKRQAIFPKRCTVLKRTQQNHPLSDQIDPIPCMPQLLKQ